ncbi:hypothetical protein [uncultured Sneathiella sp.]|uniref:hypothetical protein n=1 Tax=uncultured Sneathiella sp. TaxID=879315 RepID=UPI0030EF9D5F|tara:strand:- start:48864 stop:49388 length:525 start_codon:yes stop_codon:yes gene_type:complete
MTSPNLKPNNLTDLYFPEQLTLWGMRFWADGLQQNYSPYETLREAYSRAKCPEGLMSLDNFLSLVVAGHSRTVDIRCPCCDGISLDEWRLLQSLALAQSGSESYISDLISDFLQPATTRIAHTVISGWANELKKTGLVVPIRTAVLQTIPLTRTVTKSGVNLKVYTNHQSTTMH